MLVNMFIEVDRSEDASKLRTWEKKKKEKLGNGT